MNSQLVKTLVQIIHSLSPAEKQLLEKELHLSYDWNLLKANILERGKKLSQKMGNESLSDSISELILEMREERDQQLMESCDYYE